MQSRHSPIVVVRSQRDDRAALIIEAEVYGQTDSSEPILIKIEALRGFFDDYDSSKLRISGFTFSHLPASSGDRVRSALCSLFTPFVGYVWSRQNPDYFIAAEKRFGPFGAALHRALLGQLTPHRQELFDIALEWAWHEVKRPASAAHSVSLVSHALRGVFLFFEIPYLR